ncbi:hypothetical protein [Cupriavidus necator]
MSTPKEETWSRDNEEFRYDSLGDLLDNFGDELNVGDVVYVGEAHRPKAGDLIDADDVIETISNRGYDYGGEHADGFPEVDKAATEELDALLRAWVDKHCLPANFYQVTNVREYVLTAEDLSDTEAA